MRFEFISKYSDGDLSLPIRKTVDSAGYDFMVAEDTIVPSYLGQMIDLEGWIEESEYCDHEVMTLSEMADMTKTTHIKPTLVPTGIKCKMPSGFYLELSVRSSCPLKHWLVLANGVGIIDADYYNNSDNEGHIYFQLINLSPFDIILKKGDAIGQGILKKYYITEDDATTGERQGGFGSTDNIVNALVDVRLPNIITPDEYKYVIDKIISCDVYNNGEKIDTLDFSKDEECVMACNPERRAFIVGAPKDPNQLTMRGFE